MTRRGSGVRIPHGPLGTPRSTAWALSRLPSDTAEGSQEGSQRGAELRGSGASLDEIRGRSGAAQTVRDSGESAAWPARTSRSVGGRRHQRSSVTGAVVLRWAGHSPLGERVSAPHPRHERSSCALPLGVSRRDSRRPAQIVSGMAATASSPIGPKNTRANRAGHTSRTTATEAGEKSRVHEFGATRQGTNRTWPR